MSNVDFDKSLANLNQKQREAVNTIDGPLLVIAGPGTGKTQLLSLRVGNILKNTDAEPDNILCLTFTDAAKDEMYERLNKLIGLNARDINIFTYHALGNELINKYPEYFDSFLSASLIEEVNKINVLKNIQKKLSYRNRYKGEYFTKNLISTISYRQIMDKQIVDWIPLNLKVWIIKHKVEKNRFITVQPITVSSLNWIGF